MVKLTPQLIKRLILNTLFCSYFEVLATLTTSYVEAIREGVVPCVENALKSLALIENQRALTESVQLYKLSMDAVDLPTKDVQVIIIIILRVMHFTFKTLLFHSTHY